MVENANSEETMLSWYGHIGRMDDRRVEESLKQSLMVKLMKIWGNGLDEGGQTWQKTVSRQS